MLNWSDFSRQHHDFSARVARCFTRTPHHVLATVRPDGSPRVSGINIFFNGDDMWFGAMSDSQKVRDLDNDPRCAVHSAPLSETLDGGDGRVSGLAVPLSYADVARWNPDTPEDGRYFALRVSRVSLVTVVGKKLVVEMWDTTHGLRIVERL